MEVLCIDVNYLPIEIKAKTIALKTDWSSIITSDSISWQERGNAETNRNYKQVIPYILLKHNENFACYPRHGSETRLHGLYSCGFGGHVEKQDGEKTIIETIHCGLKRELTEELEDLSFNENALKYLGIIHEEETNVGLFHIGLVYVYEITENSLPKATDETKGLTWKNTKDLTTMNLEIWSRLAISLAKGATP